MELVYNFILRDWEISKMAPAEQKGALKSSFKGLWNYNGLRDYPVQLCFDWLADKRKDDNVGTLWRVHDKLYDLRDFIEKHPGGSDFIRLTQGTDVTEGFEASHIVNFSMVEKILAKYYVKDAETPRSSPYTFAEDGFYKTLKKRAEPILKKVGTGPTLTAKLYQDSLAAIFVASAMAGAYYQSWFAVIFAGIMLDLCMTCAHNFFHIRHHWRQYYFDLSLMSSLEWKIAHILSHHNYPNTLLDFEVTAAEPFFKFLPNDHKGWFQRYAVYGYQHAIFPFAFLPFFLKRVFNTLTLKRPMRLESYLPIVQFLAFAAVAPNLQWAAVTWMTIHGVCAYIFLLVGFATGHHHPDCFHDGDEVREKPDFGLCQLDATKDRAENISENLFFNMVSFGDHPAHHLFPTVCHSKLHHVRSVMKETMKEFGMEYQKINQLDMYTGLYQQYARTKPNPPPTTAVVEQKRKDVSPTRQSRGMD